MNATIDKHAYATIDASPDGMLLLEALDRGVSASCCRRPARDTGPLHLHPGICASPASSSAAGPRGAHPQLVRRAAGSGLGTSSTLVVALVNEWRSSSGSGSTKSPTSPSRSNARTWAFRAAAGPVRGGFRGLQLHGVRGIESRHRESAAREGLDRERARGFHGALPPGQSRDSARIIDEQARNAATAASSLVAAMHQLKADAVLMKENAAHRRPARLLGVAGALLGVQETAGQHRDQPDHRCARALALDDGAHASKVSGAGGGGFMMFVCDPVERVRLSAALAAQGGRLLDFHFSPAGAAAWRTP